MDKKFVINIKFEIHYLALKFLKIGNYARTGF